MLTEILNTLLENAPAAEVAAANFVESFAFLDTIIKSIATSEIALNIFELIVRMPLFAWFFGFIKDMLATYPWFSQILMANFVFSLLSSLSKLLIKMIKKAIRNYRAKRISKKATKPIPVTKIEKITPPASSSEDAA